MPHRKTEVDVDVSLRLRTTSGPGLPVPASLHYGADDPYAIHAVFRGGDTDVEWVFARDLLREGLVAPAGEGDVHVRPCPQTADGRARVLLRLSSPDGNAELEADEADVRRFLRRADALVPPGRETRHLDLDDLVHRLVS
ncbi:SsgA family sporulation/cell division regulator [Kineococcus sp. R8]|nr:SsgA family sporulation/cell division regulator [Kineococcus siccus]NAZ83547.1 SsgA family sporulation/cell division regulator [Kineococcus siccus]